MERSIDPEVLDKVSAIWILASNDADAIITYRGIADRVPELSEIYVKELVKSWPELFSPIVSSAWLAEWKQWIITGGHYPRWVLSKHKDDPTRNAQDIRDARNAEILQLDRSDVFRSQFRTRDRPSRSTTEEIKLGIEHLDRLRKAGMERREERLKRLTGFWLPALALGVTALTTLVSFYINAQSLENSRQIARRTAELTAADAEIKFWDLASRERGDAYEASLDAMQSAFDAAGRGDEAEMQKQLTKIRNNLYRLESLITQPDRRARLWDDYKLIASLCATRLAAGRQNPSSESMQTAKDFEMLRQTFHDRLYHLLFDKGPNEFDPMKPLRNVLQ